jgi:predicted ester cyclase
MSLKEFKAKYRWATEEVFKGNVDAVDEVCASDVIRHRPPFPDIKGAEAIKRYYLEIRQAYTDIRFDWEEIIAEGDTLAAHGTFRMKHTGVSPTLRVPPTGKEVVFKACSFSNLKNGKIVEQFEFVDYLGLLQQLGVAPPLGA